MGAFIGILRAVNAVLSIVPAMAWAVALLLAMSYGGVMHHERDSATKAKNEAIGALQQLEGALAAQKREAEKLMRDLTDKALAQQKQLSDAHQAQEKKDANSQVVIADQARKLRDAGRLRDPFISGGCRSGSGGSDSKATSPIDANSASGPQGSGLLSEEASGFLRQLALEADQVNAAYASCRADSLSIRATVGPEIQERKNSP